MNKQDELYALLIELLEEYNSVFDSAYCQCNRDDGLIIRIEEALEQYKEME